MYFVIAIIIILIDQLSKHYMVTYLSNGNSCHILGTILEFTLVKNKGAAFGILQNQTLFFIIITLMVTIALVYLLINVPGQFYAKLALSFILGGAVGNLIDRVRLGYVIDFIHIIYWPVFNVADMFIVTGSILLAVFIF